MTFKAITSILLEDGQTVTQKLQSCYHGQLRLILRPLPCLSASIPTCTFMLLGRKHVNVDFSHVHERKNLPGTGMHIIL